MKAILQKHTQIDQPCLPDLDYTAGYVHNVNHSGSTHGSGVEKQGSKKVRNQKVVRILAEAASLNQTVRSALV